MNEQQAIQEVLSNLRIENPCPMILARMRGENGTYYCNSCEKNIVDFRDCSDIELAQYIKGSESENICGIFKSSQLGGQHYIHYTLLQKAAFYALVVLSFVGFNVKPLQAQSLQTDSSKTTVTDSTTCTNTVKTIKVGHSKEPVTIMAGDISYLPPVRKVTKNRRKPKRKKNR